MSYTPYATLTDKELITVVCTKENPTDLELELMQRMEFLKDRVVELEETVETAASTRLEEPTDDEA